MMNLTAKAQQINTCGQAVIDSAMLLAHPEVKQAREELERFTAQYTADYKAKAKNKSSRQDTIRYIIPVVFHIVHNYGAENISKAQILDAMRIINEDYQNLSPDTAQVIPQFKNIVANIQTEFRLARIDPDGNCTDGITRHASLLTESGADGFADDIINNIVQWSPDKYLNIWVKDQLFGSTWAYATLPGGLAQTDGIVSLDECIGSIGTAWNTQRTRHCLSHEIGHYFNLWHTWGPTNAPAKIENCDTDDFVDDTPNTTGNFGCNLNQRICNPDIVENVQNYMDYTDCVAMFTEGQKERMYAALNSPVSKRNNLWSASNLIATGTNNGYISPQCTPIAVLTPQKLRICAGDSLTLTNFSYGADTIRYKWLLPGSDVDSSNAEKPKVVYVTPGLYDVTLIAYNSQGASTLKYSDYVEVLPIKAISGPLTVQDFETLDFPSGYWNSDSQSGSSWQITDKASFSGSKSVFLAHDDSNINTLDEFYTESYDFSNVSNPVLSFRLAFAQKNNSNDALSVYMSTGCSSAWNLRYTKAGNFLQTTTTDMDDFIPNIGEWRQDKVQINAAAGEEYVRFKFVFKSSGGNNIFIDDINFGGLSSANNDLPLNTFSISPNPTSGSLTIHGLSGQDIRLIQLQSVNGNMVKSVVPDTLSDTFSCDVSSLNNGVYYATLITKNGYRVNQKFMVIR